MDSRVVATHGNFPDHGASGRPAVLTRPVALCEIPNGARKRKYTSEDDNRECKRDLGGNIIIQPPIGSTSVALTLSPELFVLRQNLPLLFLDTFHEGRCQQGRLFQGDIAAFETESAVNLRALGNIVLIVKETEHGRLYAIELIQDNLFVLFPIQDWVALGDFERKPAKCRRVSRDSKQEQSGTAWWSMLNLDTRQIQRPAENQFKLISRVRLSMKPLYDQSSTEKKVKVTSTQSLPVEQQRDSVEETLNLDQKLVDAGLEGTIEDTIGNIRTHYLDTLYISRTSLAYFAKGPLARARASIKSDSTGKARMTDLIRCLRSNILSIPMSNKKYPDSMTELLKEIPSGLRPEDRDDNLEGPIRERVRRSRKRKKITRDGFCLNEEEYIVTWWLNREVAVETTGNFDESHDERIKNALPEQRARETQLQIILILEVLALESAHVAGLARDLVMGDDSQLGPTTPAKQTVKKQQCLSGVLDVLIDRLCIWESMNVEGGDGPENTSVGEKQLPTNAANGRLRDFCTEVVMPFYATRLPDLYATISQKLGSISIPSPQVTMKTPATKKHTKPGAAVHRPHPPRLNKSLSATATASGTRRTLSRSATDTQLTKRELTPALDLSTIPAHRPLPTATQRYQKREVDLAAVTKATEAKLARKAAAEHELRGAIAALRKPNARMAVKEYVDATDRRTGMVKARKGKPTRNPFAEGVQVAATPKIRRSGAPMANDTQSLALASQEAAGYSSLYTQELIPPSSIGMVPSSTVKAASVRQTAPGLVAATPNKPRLGKTRLFPKRSLTEVSEGTPSKRRNGIRRSISLAAVLEGNGEGSEEDEPELPVLKGGSARNRPSTSTGITDIEATPSKKRSVTFEHSLETPLKGKAKENVLPNREAGDSFEMGFETIQDVQPGNTQSSLHARGEVDNIYAALGWDDDYEI